MIGVNGVDHARRVIGYDHFFEKTPEHETQTAFNPFPIKPMKYFELGKKMSRALSRTGYKLRKKHYIYGIGDKVPLGPLVAAIYLYDITQTLKSMERKTCR